MYATVAPPNQADGDHRVEKTDKGGERPPTGVSETNWKKFQELKKRKEQCCKNSTEKRKQERRKNVIKEVPSQANQDELNILREYGVPPSPRSSTISNEDASGNRKKVKIKNEAEWKDLKQYLPQNSGLESKEKDILKKQTEEEIGKAITKGQFEKAESLSEQLSTQEFAVKVAGAVKARDYAKSKSEEQSRSQKKKKAKLHWGFEQKQRWESKGNL